MRLLSMSLSIWDLDIENEPTYPAVEIATSQRRLATFLFLRQPPGRKTLYLFVIAVRGWMLSCLSACYVGVQKKNYRWLSASWSIFSYRDHEVTSGFSELSSQWWITPGKWLAHRNRFAYIDKQDMAWQYRMAYKPPQVTTSMKVTAHLLKNMFSCSWCTVPVILQCESSGLIIVAHLMQHLTLHLRKMETAIVLAQLVRRETHFTPILSIK